MEDREDHPVKREPLDQEVPSAFAETEDLRVQLGRREQRGTPVLWVPLASEDCPAVQDPTDRLEPPVGLVRRATRDGEDSRGHPGRREQRETSAFRAYRDTGDRKDHEDRPAIREWQVTPEPPATPAGRARADREDRPGPPE